ncbi:MAG: carbamoyltransferase HypF [Roseovarius sp.]
MDAPAPRRIVARIRGRVQGVGFRPFVASLAARHGISGHVLNDAEGVLIAAEGADPAAFLAAIRTQAPPLARIDAIEAAPEQATGETGFAIRESLRAGRVAASIPPDAAVCPECVSEMFDPADRRHLYPFLSCTHCGPRYTITRALPYDRPQTSMAGFALCPACAAEYADPADRRYHAQPVACPACGPRMDMGADEIMARVLRGQIVAVKGIGGFHLCCDARNEAAVAALRARKHRPAKPFAVMVLNLASARRLAPVDAAGAALLAGPERPVVILPDRGLLAPSVGAGLGTLGLMLAYAPLHYLMFHAALGGPSGTGWLQAPCDLALVMTSANPGGEPLVTDEGEAAVRLAGIADAIAGHDRPIVTRCDDSVARVVAGAPVFLRRARGFTPDPLPLAEDGPAVLALGGLLKVAPCLARGRSALLGQHVGDVENRATRRFLTEVAAHLEHLLDCAPEAIACDAHPDYPTSRLAREMAQARGVPLVAVNHHQAHLAALAAEAGIAGPLCGLVLDGFGLGPDGGIWGGEFLRLAGTGCARLGHLAPLALPGGDTAAREPWRVAAGVLHDLGQGAEIAVRFDHPQASALMRLLAAAPVPRTSSAGRLFDAAAALLGLRLINRFEGEAAMALEATAQGRAEILTGGWRLAGGVLDLAPLMARLAEIRDPARGAALFHGTLAAALAELVAARLPAGETRVALAGGCAVNRLLTETLAARLAGRGIALILPRHAPPGDGGLALGQALVARRILKETD